MCKSALKDKFCGFSLNFSWEKTGNSNALEDISPLPTCRLSKSAESIKNVYLTQALRPGADVLKLFTIVID